MATKNLLLLILFLLLTPFVSLAQNGSENQQLVFKMDIKSDIDPRSNRYTKLALEEAERINADYVIIEMDTYGGAVDDADDIRTRILNFKKPVYVFINKDAASAGALISIACDSIYMTEGATIGAATVVTGEGVAAPDKYQSYMRKKMRATAEATGRDPLIAEAMVDERIVIDSIIQDGKVITFSTLEALKYNYCEAQVTSIEDILNRVGITNYRIENYEESATETIISFFLNPFVSSILILMIMGGLYFELQTPGVGFPLAAAILGLVLYLTPYYLNGLAENWEIIIFFAGVILIALEVFVIPGFGIAGISGLILIIASLILVTLNNDVLDFSFVKADDILITSAATLAGVLGGIIAILIGAPKLADSKLFEKIALTNTMDRENGYTSNFKKKSLVGKRGVAYTILRPSGKVLIEDEIYDASARSNYIDKDAQIEVIDEQGTSLKVKEVKEDNE